MEKLTLISEKSRAEVLPLASDLDNRAAPRYRTDIAARLTTELGERTRCHLTNLSLTGLSIELSVEAMHTLMPAQQTHDLHQPVHFQIEFSVPTSQCSDAPVAIDCTLIYCRRSRSQLFIVGAKFCEFQPCSDLILQDYIEHYAESY